MGMFSSNLQFLVSKCCLDNNQERQQTTERQSVRMSKILRYVETM